jgi:hypothetical protein
MTRTNAAVAVTGGTVALTGLAGCGLVSASTNPPPPASTVTVTASPSLPPGQPGAHPTNYTGAPAPPPSSPSADATVSCEPYADFMSNGSANAVKVTFATFDFVNDSTVDVTVLAFDTNGAQMGSQTVEFDGPFAGNQNFQQDATEFANNGSQVIGSCAIADVNGDGAQFNYSNLDPVGDS